MITKHLRYSIGLLDDTINKSAMCRAVGVSTTWLADLVHQRRDSFQEENLLSLQTWLAQRNLYHEAPEDWE